MVVHERVTHLLDPGYGDLLLPILRMSLLYQVVVDLPGAEDQLSHLQLQYVKLGGDNVENFVPT